MTRFLTLGLVIVLAGCAAAPAESDAASVQPLPSPSFSVAESSATPSPQPTPAASGPPSPTTAPDVGSGYLPPGSEVRVTVDLRLREGPTTDSAILATLPVGAVVHLAGPPFQRGTSDGFLWRWVIAGGPSAPADWRGGWVAAQGDSAFLSPEPIDCPSGTVDLEVVINMSEWERLSCLGGEELVLEGTVISGFGGYVVGSFEPEWLAHPFGVSGAIGSGDSYLMYHRPPGSPPITAVDGQRLRLTGHFDDPASESCRIATGDPEVREPDALAVDYCRERFVVTSIELIGE